MFSAFRASSVAAVSDCRKHRRAETAATVRAREPHQTGLRRHVAAFESLPRRIRPVEWADMTAHPKITALRSRHFLPNPVLFLPVVERLTVNLVNGSFCDAQRAGADGDEEINVIDCAVSSLHINADEVFVPAKIRQSIIMYRDQIKGDIFATRLNVKLLVGRFLSVRVDILFDAGVDLGFAYYQRFYGALPVACCCLRRLFELRLLWWPRMFI